MDKKYIIDEIIRTTKENNGIPLGIGRFEKETGIKHADWWGKYWSKWGDAVKEAGFKPNILTAAYNKNYLIEQMILLIREIKKFPTMGDIRMKCFNTHNFPCYNAIINGLGVKHEVAQEILSYCKDKSEYRDIIEICNKVRDADTGKGKNQDVSKENDIQFGYVYLMKSGRYYKIGKSDCVEKRHYELGTKLPEELKIIHKIKTDDPYGIEAYWHKRFEDNRKGGEWFDLSSSDVTAFKRRKGFM